jgi:glycosyltransferase involved in cell wall biosynthesis
MKAGITILICTYNGAARLQATLQHIARQHVPASVPCEVILVDNASVDNTAQLARSAWEKYDTSLELTIITESRPGLTYARETGFAHAAYEYIILCDDDNWLGPSYVETVFSIMEQHPAIGLLGGRGEFIYETPPPEWITILNLYAGGAQATENGQVADVVYGAGATLRKSAYEALVRNGFISALTDRVGYQLSSGGDYELCYALALAGYSIWYDERLYFQHFITSNRLTQAYCLTYIEESSRCFSVLEPYKILLKTGSTSRKVFRRELIKSFGYHVKKTVSLLLKNAFSKKSPAERIGYQLKLTLLKRRLQSYRQYSIMEDNFSKAVSFRATLRQVSLDLAGPQDSLEEGVKTYD